MSIPLVQENTKDAINTSIIAIKRNIERINNLLGLSGSEEIDTSIFATKEELEALENALQPVDEVTVDNMQSVTSNAVARAINVPKSVCSQVIWGGGGWYGPNTTQVVAVSYGYNLFDLYIPEPAGYHKEFMLSAQITTDADTYGRVRLNNIATGYGMTWSGTSGLFRVTIQSQPFRATDVIQETVYLFGNMGTNLYVETNNGSGSVYIYNVTVTCFLVKD